MNSVSVTKPNIPILPKPDLNPRPPRIKFPAGACDSHAHGFGARDVFPLIPDPFYYPPLVLPSDYDQMLQTIGCERAVFVQPNPYGTDNSAMLSAMKTGKLQYRGIAVIDAKTVSNKELEELHQAGVRGVRISVAKKGLTPEVVSQRVTETAARIKPFGWHLQFLVHINEYPWVEQIIEKAPLLSVVDHFCYLPASEGVQAAGFQQLVRLARLDHVWFKLIGYRSSTELPHYLDVKPFAQTLFGMAPDRCVWGTDWPHTNIVNMPNDGDLADALGEWLPNTADRDKVLVGNPARLFDF